MRKAGDQADLLLTDSEYTRTELIEDFGLAGDRVVAVPLGVAPEYHPRSRGEAAAVLDKYDLPWQSFSLCVATVEPRKNIQGLLAAYRGLPAGLRAECPLVLVGGKGWNSDAIHAEINEAVGEGWLKYLGFVAESELPLVYAAAKAFLFPSWYEGYGLPVLQAMASGVPCLSSDRSSLPEVSLDAAWLVDPADGPAVLEGTHRVLTDEAWRRQAAAKGLVIARTKTWDECARRTFEVYRRVADGSR
jgi:alpha-1,3-rhamnosyl/mannosyltransferase